jgi:starvation-inducible outer membrane lipoprotein
MKSVSLVLAILSLMISGCSTPALFPPEATTNVTPSEFGVLHAQPDVFKGRVVQLAGRIVGVEESANGFLIRAQELPFQEHPAYGPAETNKRTPEFAITYRGKLDDRALWFGNKLVVLAVAQGDHNITVDGIVRREPLVVAKCMHVWKTGEYGSYGISDFPHVTDTYYPLEHETYCVN